MSEFNNTTPPDNEESQLRESLAMLQLLSISSADADAGRLSDSDTVFAELREMIEEKRQKQE
jgi:hypothetical protein